MALVVKINYYGNKIEKCDLLENSSKGKFTIESIKYIPIASKNKTLKSNGFSFNICDNLF